jgi:hypothetical protein
MDGQRRRQCLLALIGGAGVLIFGAFLALTFSTPRWVEDFAAGFIAKEVSKQIDQGIDAVKLPAPEGVLAHAADALLHRNAAEIERLREALSSRAHEAEAEAIARMRDLDCECRAKWSRWLAEGRTAQLHLLEQANAKLADFIQGRYARVVAELKRDLRVFAFGNLAAFVLIVVLAFSKPRASAQLFVPALLLAATTAICSYFYLFEQNWLLTLVYEDYLGFAYLGYLALVFALLCDVALNRARLTTRLANALLDTLGSAATLVPC